MSNTWPFWWSHYLFISREFGHRNARCVMCHGGADFLSYSIGGLRKQVNMEATKCFICHGKGSQLEFYAK